MPRFVVVVNSETRINEATSEYGGDVVDTKGTGDQVVATVKFDDEAAGGAFSRALNGTVYGAEWAARENARHRATASV